MHLDFHFVSFSNQFLEPRGLGIGNEKGTVRYSSNLGNFRHALYW